MEELARKLGGGIVFVLFFTWELQGQESKKTGQGNKHGWEFGHASYHKYVSRQVLDHSFWYYCSWYLGNGEMRHVKRKGAMRFLE